MTGKPTSPLGLAANAVLDISVEREACPMRGTDFQHREHSDDGRRIGNRRDAGARL